MFAPTVAWHAAAEADCRQPLWVAILSGFGHLHTGTATATRFSTWRPGSSYTGYANYRPYLKVAPTWDLETMRPSDASTAAGAAEIRLVDVNENLAALLAFYAAGTPVAGSRPTLVTTDVGRDDVTIYVNDHTGITTSRIYFLDQEAVYVSASAAGPSRLTVTRGLWDTDKSRHYVGTPILTAMGDPAGTYVELRKTFVGLAAVDEHTVWAGYLRSISQEGGAGKIWRFDAESLAQASKRKVLRRLGQLRVWRRTTAARSLTLQLEDDSATGRTFADTQQQVYVGSSAFDGALLVNKDSATATPVQLDAVIDGTVEHETASLSHPEDWRSEDLPADATVHEVLPADPLLPSTRFGYYTQASGYVTFVPVSHPLLIWLCLLLSRTGDKSNVASGEDCFDVLPEGIGAEELADRVSVPQIMWMAARHPVRTPNLMFGLSGESAVLESLEANELLAPWGFHRVQRYGRVEIVEYRQAAAWDEQASQTIAHRDIPKTAPPVAHGIQFPGALREYVARTGYRWADGEFSTTVSSNGVLTPSWAIKSGRKMSRELHGLPPGAPPQELVRYLTDYVQRHGRTPPSLDQELVDQLEHLVHVGSTVLLTSSIAMDFTTGRRGIVDYPYIVLGKRSESGRIRVSLAAQHGAIRGAAFAPALRVTVVNSATDFDVAEEDFTEPGRFDDRDVDTDWFTTDDYVVVLDGDTLAPVSATSRKILTKAADNITVSAAFPVAPVVGDYIAFEAYHQTADATIAWQGRFAHLAVDGRLNGTDDAPYILVG